MDVPGRREGVVKLVRSLKEKGLRIDAVGMQGHMGMDYPDIRRFEESMLAFAATGVKVMITEWDMSALPTARRSANISDTVAFKKSLNPYPDALPDSVNQAWNKRMQEFFQLFEKHADIVERVTAWGVTDEDSWKIISRFEEERTIRCFSTGITSLKILYGNDRRSIRFRNVCKEINVELETNIKWSHKIT